jgi:hypothetical protein
MRRFGTLLAALALASCGYVGDPLPPSLNIPPAVQDLRVEQRSSEILIQFTLPGAATDGAPFRSLRSVELRAGEREFAVPSLQPGPIEVTEPAAAWIGQTLEFRVRTQGPTGRWSDWSALAAIRVIAPLDPPSSLTVAGTAQGVRLAWESNASRFRVFRDEEPGEPVAASESSEHTWLDESAMFGVRYTYRVQAVEARATSDRSAPVSIVYEDRFPPAAPAEVQAVAGLTSIELTWQPPPEPDLAGFFVYRAEADGVFQRLVGPLASPSLSDGMVAPGTMYRYAVTSVDALGNESPRSLEVAAIAP